MISVVACPVPTLSEDKTMANTSDVIFPIGSVLKVTCRSGWLGASHNMTCTDSRQWSETVPCERLPGMYDKVSDLTFLKLLGHAAGWWDS